MGDPLHVQPSIITSDEAPPEHRKQTISHSASRYPSSQIQPQVRQQAHHAELTNMCYVFHLREGATGVGRE